LPFLPPLSDLDNEEPNILHGPLNGHLDLPRNRTVERVVVGKREEEGGSRDVLVDEDGKLWESVELKELEVSFRGLSSFTFKEEQLSSGFSFAFQTTTEGLVGLKIKGRVEGLGFDGSMLRGSSVVHTLIDLLIDRSIGSLVGFVDREEEAEIDSENEVGRVDFALCSFFFELFFDSVPD